MNFRSVAFILLVAGLAFGQHPAKKDPPKEPAKPTPGSLEDTLEKSLRNSADIKAAEAKVRDAEAELNKVRHQVLTKATSLHSDLNVAKRMLANAEQTLSRYRELMKSGSIGPDVLMTSQAVVEKHRGEVEKLEAELKSLRGEFAIKALMSVTYDPDGRYLYTQSIDEALRVWDLQTGKLLQNRALISDAAAKSAAVQTPMAERVRKLLDQEMVFESENLSISDIFSTLLDRAKSEVPHRNLLGANSSTVTLAGKMPLGAWFQAIEDSDENVAIVVRDYGILMTQKDRVPKGAVGISELWKSKNAKPKEEPNSK